MTTAQYCYGGPDDGATFTVPNGQPPEHWRKPRLIPVHELVKGVDPSTVVERYDLFRYDGTNDDGIARYVFVRSYP